MHIEISLHDGVPIYRQIVNQVKYLIAAEKLSADKELPPIRALAEQLQVTPNTVVKAYRELETQGLVYKRQGAGTFVADTSSPIALKEKRKILERRADALLVEASHLNFSFSEVMDLLKRRNDLLEKSRRLEG